VRPQPDDTEAEAIRPIMAELVEKTTAEDESTYHTYTSSAIPWYVRAIWIFFWCGAIAYVITWLLPALQSELLKPP
jgi:hypothetical protein